MGLGVSENARTLLAATHYQLYRFDNLLPPGARSGDSDAIYAPRLSWITGDLDIHDVGFASDGSPIFVNTLFSCLSTTSEGFSFKPIWRPPFISKLAPEDRCHLNGLAIDAGLPRYVSVVSTSDVADGWRDRRSDGGIVLEIATGKTVVEGLSMPHSPRLHAGKLWVLNSGAGEFGWVDLDTSRFVPVAFCPGYARGLAFAAGAAIVGLSMARDNRTFQGLPLDARLAQKAAEPRCGLNVIDLDTGDTVAWVRLEGVVRELYDVVFLPGITCPLAVGFKTDEITRLISIDEN
jgi:uncharacterized protein (TIGR03032 family)